MKNIDFIKIEKGFAPIGNVQYGTVITSVPGHESSIYMKVSKHHCGQGISIGWSAGHSVLVNLKSGTIRQIKGDIAVRILEEHLTLAPVSNIDSYTKDYTL